MEEGAASSLGVHAIQLLPWRPRCNASYTAQPFLENPLAGACRTTTSGWAGGWFCRRLCRRSPGPVVLQLGRWLTADPAHTAAEPRGATCSFPQARRTMWSVLGEPCWSRCLDRHVAFQAQCRGRLLLTTGVSFGCGRLCDALAAQPARGQDLRQPWGIVPCGATSRNGPGGAASPGWQKAVAGGGGCSFSHPAAVQPA